MAKKRQQKDELKRKTKQEQSDDAQNERIDNIEEFLGSIFGNDFEIQNIQYLLGTTRAIEQRLQQALNENTVFRQYVQENKLDDKFLKWQESKQKEAQAQHDAHMKSVQSRDAGMEQSLEDAKKERLKELESDDGKDGKVKEKDE